MGVLFKVTFESLHDYVNALDNVGELKKIKTPVSADLEVAEILRRLMYKTNQPAVLFENVDGHKYPILGNAFGSIDRLKLALDLDDFTEIGERIAMMSRMRVPSSIFGKLKMLPKLTEIADYGPKRVESGPVYEVILAENEASLALLPITKSFPLDAGRFITFGITVTKNPETAIQNLGIYRLQVLGNKKAIMHWQVHKRGALHYQLNKDENKRTEVAIIIGADPAIIFSAIAPVPEGMDKYFFAGITRKKGVKLVKCKTVDIQVPATSEIVLEGYVDPNEINIEGPFGDHTGYYTPPEPYPTFTLTGMMMRHDPIFLTTVVGKPILEDAYIGKVIERSFLPLIRMFHPEVTDFSMPPAGWFQGLAIIAIRKRYPGQAKKVMMGLWGMGQLSLTKIIVVVDDDVNIHNMNEVIWAVTTRSDPKRDVTLIENTPTDTLDPASPLLNLGSKMGIDATKKTLQEGYMRPIQHEAFPDTETIQKVNGRWQEYGLNG
jgi:4-hydroxy-3-polyprenylbenzoate decarboxylase